MIVYNGKNLKDFGLHTDESLSLGTGTPDIESVSVPGRNGDLHFSNGRISNITLNYQCFIREHFAERFEELQAFLLQDQSYHRLEDSRHLDYFRMATVDTPPTYTGGPWLKSGTLTLTFNCKPQKWLKSGEISLDVRNGTTLRNPTYYAAKPKIDVAGAGTLTIGDITVECSEGMTIDCDIKDCYSGTKNENGNIILRDGDFPELKPGDTKITFTGFDSVRITPNWWTI